MNDSKRAQAVAAELAVAKATGIALGLTGEQCAEVIDAWLEWYRSVGIDVNPRAIKSRVIDRTWGQEWQPPNQQVTELAIPFAGAMAIPVSQAVATIEAAMEGHGRGVEWTVQS